MDWTEHVVVLDVSTEATGISFGILLTEAGAVWLSDVRIEVVDSTTPLTAPKTMPTAPKEPSNLSFLER